MIGAVLLARALVLVATLALGVGCVVAQDDAAAAPGDDEVRAPDACLIDTDCTLAGPSCCECPSFAVANAGWADACEQVDCQAPPDCPALEARCDRGTCVAACAPTACDLQCETGFAVDAAGCTVCACPGGPVAAQCQLDGDCARVPGDCCGCERGGVDLAVPAGEAAGYVDSLGCTGAEACPGVSTCEAGAEVRCLSGQCTLVAATAPPADGTCGRPDLPPCPVGQVCVINAPDAESGVGRCEAP